MWRRHEIAKTGLASGLPDCELSIYEGDFGRGKRRKATPTESLPQPLAPASARPTKEERDAATFLFIDAFHGKLGGFGVVGKRLGGVCIGACDSDLDARAAYRSLHALHNELDHAYHLDRMSDFSRMIQPADIFFGGFPCQPVSLHKST